jgi:hypothetical protein
MSKDSARASGARHVKRTIRLCGACRLGPRLRRARTGTGARASASGRRFQSQLATRGSALERAGSRADRARQESHPATMERLRRGTWSAGSPQTETRALEATRRSRNTAGNRSGILRNPPRSTASCRTDRLHNSPKLPRSRPTLSLPPPLAARRPRTSRSARRGKPASQRQNLPREEFGCPPVRLRLLECLRLAAKSSIRTPA